MAGYGNFQYEGARPVGFEAYPPPPSRAPDVSYPMSQPLYPRTNEIPANTVSPNTYYPSPNSAVAPIAADDPANLPPVGFEGAKDSPATPTDVALNPSYRKSKADNTLFFTDGKRRIDFILSYEIHAEKDREWQEKRQEKRDTFETNLEDAGLQLEREGIESSQNGKTAFVKVHAPWKVLTRMAEEMLMKMPIKENDMDTRDWSERCFDAMNLNNPFELRNEDLPEQPNYFTCAFRRDKMDRFLIPSDRDSFFSAAERNRIVYRILHKAAYGDKSHQIGIDRLLSNSSYLSAYPLHEGDYKMEHSTLTHKPENDRQILHHTWSRLGRWYKMQPLDYIRKYFGEKIGIYFAWLGYYTGMLVPAALVGLISVLYGIIRLGSYIPVQDICDEEMSRKFPMCPRCDVKCGFWSLKEDTCLYSKVAYVFDNEFTVIFAVFMSLWATGFLEFWKRRQTEIAYEWDLMGFEDEEERPRPEYEALATDTRINPITREREPYISLGRKIPRFCFSGGFIVFMLCLVLGAVIGVIVYRLSVYAVLIKSEGHMGTVTVATSATAALLNLIVIMLLSKVYEKLAETLTKWEMPRTQTDLEDIFAFKMYLFQFVNYYSSLFYIAFGKLNPGRPGDYNRIFGFRQEECNPAGCLFELLLQLAVIMVGKQIFNNFMEIIVPKLQVWWSRRQNMELPDMSNYERWELDFNLTDYPSHGLFYEYLEIVIQYGFITLFVTAFPLGPLFALINNLIEIRLDAYKFNCVFKRPMAARAQDIGIWYAILNAITKISVVVNAFVLAFVSEFVPRLYHTLGAGNDNLENFLNASLSCFYIPDYNNITEMPNKEFITDFNKNFENGSCGFGMYTCRYRGYREPPFVITNNVTLPNGDAYVYSKAHWHILTAKLFFVVAFLHVVFGLTGLLAYIIPDVPKKVSNQVKRENFLAREALRSAEVVDSTVTSPQSDRSARREAKSEFV